MLQDYLEIPLWYHWELIQEKLSCFIKVLGVAGFGGSSTRLFGLFGLLGSLLKDISWQSNPEMLLVSLVLRS